MLDYGKRASVQSDFLLLTDTFRSLLLRVRTSLVEALVPVRLPFVLLTQVLLVIVGYRMAYNLRFDFAVPAAEEPLFWQTLPILLMIRLLVYSRFGLHQGYWRHVSTEDLTTICQAVTVSSAGFLAVCAALGLFPGVPRSVLVLDWVVGIFLTGGLRFVARAVLEAKAPESGGPRQRALVIGAGNRAEHLLREIRRDAGMTLHVVGIVVDDPGAENRSIHGVRVVGTIDHLDRTARVHAAGLVIIALDEPTAEQTQRIVAQCTQLGLEFKTVPSLKQLLEGSARADQLRSLRLEDLLGRPPVTLELGHIEAQLRDKGRAGDRRCRLDRIGARPADRPLPARPVGSAGPRGERRCISSPWRSRA